MKNKFTIVFGMLVLLLAGCYPQGPEFIEDLDVVITNHAPEYDFSSKGTFAMPDKIVKITGNLLEGEEPRFIPDVTDPESNAEIRESNINYAVKQVFIQ